MKIILDVYEPMIYSGTGDSIVDINKGDYPHISPTLWAGKGINFIYLLYKTCVMSWMNITFE